MTVTESELQPNPPPGASPLPIVTPFKLNSIKSYPADWDSPIPENLISRLTGTSPFISIIAYNYHSKLYI